ncbi:MAG: 3-isopropylmalate dehydratase small subunit, partial [Bacillota bacterium]|nr:3-isopropylmalate dehydratase small subunit [Bacillota bacterium]
METVVGKVLMLGNNVDTDQIYPGRYLSLVDPKEIATHCLEDVDKNIAKTFRDGDIIVAGKNFGCGSSREHAPIALKNMGVSLIIAESFARIFYRNSLNIGLPLMICKKMTKSLNNDDYISVNLKKGELLITSTG